MAAGSRQVSVAGSAPSVGSVPIGRSPGGRLLPRSYRSSCAVSSPDDVRLRSLFAVISPRHIHPGLRTQRNENRDTQRIREAGVLEPNCLI